MCVVTGLGASWGHTSAIYVSSVAALPLAGWEPRGREDSMLGQLLHDLRPGGGRRDGQTEEEE